MIRDSYRHFWDRHLERTRSTETLLTDDPERLTGKYAHATVSVLLRHVDPGTLRNLVVMDYGCGTGRLARLIAPMCKKLICADVSLAALAECRQRLANFTNVEYLQVDGISLGGAPAIDFIYSYAAIQYFGAEDDFWATVASIDRAATSFCLHLHNTPNENPDPSLAPGTARAGDDFPIFECYRPSEWSLRKHFPSSEYFVERHQPDVRGMDLFFYKSSAASASSSWQRRRFLDRQVTFFYTDNIEFQTAQPVAEEALRRGYQVRLSRDLSQPSVVGVYCQHAPIPNRSDLSVIMLHDLAQMHGCWPHYWRSEPWDNFDIGILPGPSWSRRWLAASSEASARTRRGVYQLGWPKADIVFRRRKEFAAAAQELRQQLGLKYPRSILYAPSWENDGKQDDFVRQLAGLPVNLLLKQAPWSENYPDIVANIEAMNDLHRGAGDNIFIIEPTVSIMHCLALADILVSDESSVLVEALLFGITGVAVMDWLIPDTVPSRRSDVPFDFVVRTERAAIRQCVEGLLADPERSADQVQAARDEQFAGLGQSAHLIMDVIDAHVEDRVPPYAPLQPRRPTLLHRWFGAARRSFDTRGGQLP